MCKNNNNLFIFMSKLTEIKKFCNENDILCISSNLEGDKILFYLMSLYLNDISRPVNKRLTISEQHMLAHIIDYTIMHGVVEKNKERYDSLINFLIDKKAIKNKPTFNTNKTNLINKGYLQKFAGRNSVVVPERMIKSFSHGNINIFISKK